LNAETAKGTFIAKVNSETITATRNQNPRLGWVEPFFITERAYQLAHQAPNAFGGMCFDFDDFSGQFSLSVPHSHLDHNSRDDGRETKYGNSPPKHYVI